MTIHGIDSSGGYQPTDPTPQAQGAEQNDRADRQQQAARHQDTDSVEISSAARELARLSDTDGSSLDAQHLRSIADRLATGFYDSPEVQVEIANRIRSSGDFADPTRPA